MAFKMYVDGDGLPYSDYGNYKGIDIGRQRSILAVAERGLWYWNEYLRGSEPAVLLSYDWEKKWPENRDEFRPGDADKARHMLLTCAEWMKDNIQDRDGFSVWAYPYSFSYGTSPGWRSAHAQAVGLQLLARAAEISGEEAYLEKAAPLLAAFTVEIKDGGIATRTEGGNIWFEKIADENNEEPKVINGLLFTILGLLDIAKRTNLPGAGQLAELGVSAAVELLPRFDLGDWSAYDIKGKPASDHYHRIHIEQLRRLAEQTGEPSFAEYRDRFRGYGRDVAPAKPPLPLWRRAAWRLGFAKPRT